MEDTACDTALTLHSAPQPGRPLTLAAISFVQEALPLIKHGATVEALLEFKAPLIDSSIPQHELVLNKMAAAMYTAGMGA